VSKLGRRRRKGSILCREEVGNKGIFILRWGKTKAIVDKVLAEIIFFISNC
jgi:hypothetical protein